MKTLSRKLPPSTLQVIHAITGEEVMPESRLAQHLIGLIYAVDPTIWARKVDLCLHGGDPLLLARRLGSLAANLDFRSRCRVAIIDDGQFSGAPMAALEDVDIARQLVEARALPPNALSGEEQRAEGIIQRLVKQEASRVISAGVEILWISGRAQGARDHLRDEIVLRLCSDRKADVLDAGPRAVDGPARSLFERSRLLAEQGRRALLAELGPCISRPPRGDRFADIIVAERLEVLSGFVSPGRHPDQVRFDASFMTEIGAEVFRFGRRVPTSVEDAIADWREDLSRAAGHVAC